MTKSYGTQVARYNSAMDRARDYAQKEYDTYDQWMEDLNNYMGTYDNRMYDGDMHAIHRSGGGWDQRGQALGKDMVKGFENYTRDKLKESWQDKYGATNWQNQYLSRDIASNYLDNYLNTEYENALGQLERAMKRGTLNDDQYNNALSKLSLQRNAANATYGQIDDQLMDTYAQDLQTLANNYGNDLENWDLSDYDSNYTNNWDFGIQDKQAEIMNGLTSAIDNNILAIQGDNPMFDVNSIIGGAKTASGVYNNKSDNLMQAITDEEENKKKQQIGLGNQGMF
jgi:hypothetical protein